MYLFEWGSTPSLLLSDMMESMPSGTRKYGREKDYSSELTAPPSSEDTSTRL
jgi:hypothetical protein